MAVRPSVHASALRFLSSSSSPNHAVLLPSLTHLTLSSSWQRPSLTQHRGAPSATVSQQQARGKATVAPPKKGTPKSLMSSKDKAALAKRQARKKNPLYTTHSLDKVEQFALCDAMRILRAYEVGYPPDEPKYELAIKLRTKKNGPVLTSRLQLPHPVRTDLRVCVIVDPNSAHAEAARAAGATLVGTDDVFETIRAGKLEFDRCICHEGATGALHAANLGRILGPRRLMPSAKEKTVVADVGGAVAALMSSAEYREKIGVIRLPVGRLAFSPEEMRRNVAAVLANVNAAVVRYLENPLHQNHTKGVHEVVLSSTHGPGMSLTGQFVAKNGTKPEDLKEYA